MADRKPTTDNFDNEFRMEKKTKAAPRGKLPSWIMILAGAAVIGGAVAARQPAVRPTETGTRAAVTVTDNSGPVADTAGFTGMNDQKADSAELEAFFGAQNGGARGTDTAQIVYAADHQPYAMKIQPLEVDDGGYIIPPEDTESDGAVYWLDDQPYAVTIKSAEMNGNDAPEEKSVYAIGDTLYDVQLEKLSAEEAAALPQAEQFSLLKIGGESYKLSLEPVDGALAAAPSGEDAKDEENVPSGEAGTTGDVDAVTTGKAEPADPADTSDSSGSSDVSVVSDGNENVPVVPEADDEPFKTLTDSDPAAKEVPADEEEKEPPVIAWIGEKPYEVTVKPLDETTEPVAAEPSAPEAGEPAKADAEVSDEEPDRAVVFELEDKKYEVQLKESDKAALPAEDSPAPIVWADQTPLELSISESASDQGAGDGLEIVLSPVSEEKRSELLKERFGEEAVQPKAAPAEFLEEPTEVPAADPDDEENVEEQRQNFFVKMFNDIFGDDPTPEPEPQVTVIPVVKEGEPDQPEPTAIVLHMTVPTAVPQGPVRLDAPAAEETGSEAAESGESSIGTDDAGVDQTEAPEAADPESGESGTEQTESILSDLLDPALLDVDEDEETEGPVKDEGPIVSNDPMIVIHPTHSPDAVRLEPTVVPETEELPHTGMADGWNIPSMLALFAGLLMLIIGIRRLRTRE